MIWICERPAEALPLGCWLLCTLSCASCLLLIRMLANIPVMTQEGEGSSNILGRSMQGTSERFESYEWCVVLGAGFLFARQKACFTAYGS